jgi:hypothetical protein
MTRRELLAAAATASAGAFLLPTPARAREAVTLVAASRGTAYDIKVYNAHEWATVRLLVDYIIPKDARSGAATDAAVPEFMDTMLDLDPTMRPANRGGLAWLDHQSRERFGQNFVDASDTQRRQLLDLLAWPARAPKELSAGVAWFSSFRALTASGFFTSEMGVNDLGYEGNAPVMEWHGCPPEALARLGVRYP